MKYVLYALAAFIVAAALLSMGHILISAGTILFFISGALGAVGVFKRDHTSTSERGVAGS